MKRQFKNFMMVDSERKIIECATYGPSYLLGMANADFTTSEAGAQAAKKRQEIASDPIVHGNMIIITYKPGYNDLECVPTLVPSILNRVELTENSVILSTKAIGGAPEFVRMLAADAIRCDETPMKGGGVNFEVEYPLYNKVVIGLDDTDSSTKGATFVTGLRIASILEKAIKRASDETSIAFGKEIIAMFNAGEYEKIVFLSFPYISDSFELGFIKERYDDFLKFLNKKYGLDLINAKSFDYVLNWFEGEEVEIYYSGWKDEK